MTDSQKATNQSTKNFVHKEMRSGYTTGSCATAGMKAALLALLRGENPRQVTITNPQGQTIDIPVAGIDIISSEMAEATIIKDAGDDPDVTHGAEVVTTVTLTHDGVLRFEAGSGVGTVTKPGLALSVGEPAINPGPRAMMGLVYNELCPPAEGVLVTVSVTNGRELAKKTLNATLGIEGGISIIGTTGIVKPMSEEGFKNSLIPQLHVMKAAGYKTAVLVPGRIGLNLGQKKLGISPIQMAETSNFIGFMLEECVKAGFKDILIIGHIGKIVKLASGSFHTHNRMSDGRIETLMAYAALEGASREVVQEIMECNTTEAVMPILEREHLTGVYQRIADRASLRSERYIANEAHVGVMIATLDGKILAMDKEAKRMGGDSEWNIPSM
ncbi:MAG: cobalamin biosynthesis protein CbiD [Veillonella sp.]|uniref:cobalt-precorrin-5B (C(1))-methyltransferase CbiD n=1 Tax=Veillonella sp. TaxID=1926307 RepID=UPI0025D0EAAD|nr:cobalt-precorrin-5B (C(1))-methyltransferase CbiD [Veillonella sp.]MBS4913671.1 cobalamin biosynthesis protein CbiD [Veillonella sp.]